MNTSLIEPTILVTGATDGIGKGTARELARRGARVLLHGRSAERVAAARDEIAAATGNDRLETYVADFASLRDVHHLAKWVQVKHPAPLLLTHLLLQLLRAGAPARIVNPPRPAKRRRLKTAGARGISSELHARCR